MCRGLIAPPNDELEENFDTILQSSKAENQLPSLPSCPSRHSSCSRSRFSLAVLHLTHGICLLLFDMFCTSLELLTLASHYPVCPEGWIPEAGMLSHTVGHPKSQRETFQGSPRVHEVLLP